MAQSDVDVVIVGAGSAGLAAALAAQERGLSFALLEASHRTGGRAYTEDIAPGMPFDLGCHWMHSASLNPFVAIADRFGFHYRRDIAWRTHVFAESGWTTEQDREAMQAEGALNEGAIAAAAARGEDVAVADVIDLKARWAALHQYWYSLGSSHDIDELSIVDVVSYNDTEENWPLREGYGALVQRWAADVPVTLNAPVTKVRWGGNGVSVESARGTIRGRRLLLTVSTNILAAGRIAFDPPLPGWKLEAASALPLGVHNRIGVMLTRDPFGPHAERSVTIMGEGDEPPLSILLRPFGFDYVVGVTGGRFGAWLERAGAAASVDHLSERLVKAFGSDVRSAFSPRSIVTAWQGDPWTLGSYSAAAPGSGHRRKDIARPVDDILYFAGEATSTEFFATCHGAYLSGVAAIESIAKSLRAGPRGISAAPSA
jgi:monoamine oxidase